MSGDNKVSQQVGLRIRERRLALGIKQRAFGERIQPPRSVSNISELERGVNPISVDFLHQASMLLQCDPAWLLTGKVPT